MQCHEIVKSTVRTPAYYREVVKWFSVLLPKLRKHLYTVGGPIIMVQLENEYGYNSACDGDYMSMLYDMARLHLGQDIILFTTDGNSEQLLRCGSPDQRYLAAIDFAPTSIPPNASFASVEKFRPGQPLINSEFYVGWYDTWGSHHARRSAELVQESLIDLMEYSPRVSVNLYVFHGGTSFGFWNGKPSTIPAITSYDFDAPLSEAGDVTYKYELLQKAIHKFRNRPKPPLPKNSTKKAYGVVQMQRTSHLLLRRGPKMEWPVPQNMEALRQYDGFTSYCSTLPAGQSKLQVNLKKFADTAYVFTADTGLEMFHWHGTLEAPNGTISLDMQKLQSHTKLVLLLENTGYVNFGEEMWNNVKGLLGSVTVNEYTLRPWMMMPIKSPLEVDRTTLSKSFDNLPVQGALYTGDLIIPQNEQPEDTFIQPDGFSQGIAAVNSHVIGHFDQQLGPQLRLYVPKQFLKPGRNRVTICELRNVTQPLPQVSSLAETKWMDGLR